MNEAIVDYVNEQSVNWYDGRPWWIVWMLLIVLLVAANAFGIWRRYKEEGKVDVVAHLMGVGKAFAYVFYSFLGNPPVNPVVIADADNKYAVPSKDVVLRVLPRLFLDMKDDGYGKENYHPEYPDCDDFTAVACVKLRELLFDPTTHLSANVRPYSFRRDDGKRHRLAMVETTSGPLYVENYPVFDAHHSSDGMLRMLSTKEKRNGVLL